MRVGDIDNEVIHDVVARLPSPFHTRDVSEHPLMLRTHGAASAERSYHATVGKALKRLQGPHGAPALVELQKGTSRGSRWQKASTVGLNVACTHEGQAAAERSSSVRREGGGADLVRAGHYRTLDYMQTAEFLQVKRLLERYSEIGGVYFRPTDRGVTMVDLHPTSPKPRVGVGADPVLRLGTSAEELAPTIPDRIEHLQAVRARQASPSAENQLEARIIREALAKQLKMPGFPERLRFIHSQWRIHLAVGQRFTDLLAVDTEKRQLVLIELKREPDLSALSQVADYVRFFATEANQLVPFFAQVAKVMGRLYGCEELVGSDELTLARVGMTAWPSSSGELDIRGLREFDDGSASPEPQLELGKWSSPLRKSGGVDSGALGPQHRGDNAFTARMRRHQSWYRATVLQVSCGTGPKAHNTTSYGNMLRPEDGGRGLNFLTPTIHAVALERLKQNTGAVEPYRLLNNMLSSQPMCFNLFGPLVRDAELATKLWKQLLPGRIAEVTSVRIEYAPTPTHEYLNDRTAFDAFVEYRRTDGGLSFLGIETKLTEPFSRRRYDRDEYRRWMRRPGAPWRPEAARRVDEVRHNQLWRDHLLSVAMSTHPESRYVAGHCMLVRHPEDAECEAVVSDYQALLKEGDESFIDMPLDRLIAAWSAADRLKDEVELWLKAFTLRYLELGASGS